jgi:hypothetical protein
VSADDASAMSAEEDSAPPSGLVHGLRWGIKRSFIEYVQRMPDGRGWVGDGALPIAPNDIFFQFDAPNSADSAESAAVLAFTGDVRFTGHYGMLFVRVARPRLHVSGNTAVMTIEDSQGGEQSSRVPLVTAELELIETRDGTEIWGGANVHLSDTAVELFNEVYAAGEPFETFVVQIPAGKLGRVMTAG